MPKFIFMPPQDQLKKEFAARLSDSLPEYDVHSPETNEEAKSMIKDADAAMGWIPPESLKLARKIKWLHNPDAGPFFGYYYKELCEHNLVITNPRGIYWDHISHHIMMFVLALSRGLPWFEKAKSRKKWDKQARKSPYVHLGEATALINGVGGIGHETARLCKEFGMQVIGIDPRPEYKIPGIEIYTPDNLMNLLSEADFVISTVPHTPETEFMFNSQSFQKMKSTAYFINIGRGMVCKLDDLVNAIESNEIAGCGLDVFETEPLPEKHKLWQMDNVLITPHIAVADAQNLSERRYEILFNNAKRFAENKSLINIVDKEKMF
jgi:phosphoglycerate dehydrogenase-like enzyme